MNAPSAQGISAQALSEQGPLAEALEGFKERIAQQEMAEEVESALKDKAILVAESGTGTGKTFAYLVPAILSGQRIIISTGTRHLQDQLFLKDLPTVQRALGVPIKYQRLKGRANYLCLFRLSRSEEALFKDPQAVADRARVQAWSTETRSGDISELDVVADDSGVWPEVTSTADNCLGNRCEYFQDCYVYAARREAMKAELVVVNHHLFFSDLAIKDEGFGEVLPEYDAVIFDEGHLIPEVAAQFFGFGFSTNQVITLCREIRVAEAAEKSGVRFNEALEAAEKTNRELLLAAPRETRDDLDKLEKNADFQKARDAVAEALSTLGKLLESAADSGESLNLLHQRCADIQLVFDRFRFQEGSGTVYWFDSTRRSLRMQATPITVADQIRQSLLSEELAMVFTSATLSSQDEGQHYCSRMGLDHYRFVHWLSPYAYRSRALMYVPDGLPDPSSPRVADTIVEQVVPVLRMTGGRGFLLFTSYRVLHEVEDILRERDEFQLLVQGEAPKHRLIELFQQNRGCVLLGTSSFWEGVDVRGDALVLVMIDKLPFASPFDPVNRARLNYLEQNGQQPFRDYQLPQAVLAMKQGAGRLIRDETDYGILMICDPRIRTKQYGRVFIDALPPMRRTTRLDAVQTFLGRFEETEQT